MTMNMGAISLLVLVLAIAIGFFRKINVGILSILAAVILGYGSGQFTGKQIISGFSGSLFMTLAGVTLLFAIVQSNGCLELLIKKIVVAIGKFVVLIPVVMFLFGWLISASGPGLIPTAALVVVISIPLAHETGYDPVMLAIIGVHAANAGRVTKLTTEGVLINTLLAEQGYTESVLLGTCLSITILAVILSVITYVGYKGYKVSAVDIHITESEKSFTKAQILSMLGMLVMAGLILFAKFEVGLAAFAVGSALILLKVCDEKEAIKRMPWSTILLVLGVGVLMNLVIELGGIDLLSNFLSSIMTPMTASALSGIAAGILSWFSSTLGVVMPTFLPTVGNIVTSVGGGVTVLEIVAAIVFASSSAGLSPASTAGALIMAACSGDPEFSVKHKPEKLFIQLFAWAAASIAFIAVISLTGYFRWFA